MHAVHCASKGTLIALASLKSRLQRTNGDVIALAVALSPFIPLWLIWHSDRINKDGIWHLAMAEHMAAGDWSAAMDLLAWPLFPAILVAIHTVTGLSLEAAGYVWIVIAYGLTTFAFLSILRELGGNRTVLLFGLAVLFLHPALNNTLPGIFRDQGYWAFYLLSILLLLRYIKSPGWGTAVGWWLAMSIAMLFRVEGGVFLALLPLILLIRADLPVRRRLSLIGKAHCLTIAIAVIGIIALLGTNFNVLELGRFTEFELRGGRVWTHLTEGVSARADVLREDLLSEYAHHQAFGAVWMIMGYILLDSTLTAVNWVYLAIAGAAIYLRRLPDQLPMLIWIIALNVLILAMFVISEMFLSFRYAAGLGFIVMVVTAFGMAGLWERYMAKWGLPLKLNWGFPAAAVALGIVGGDGLYSIGATKVHETEVGRWIKAHAPVEASVYFDNPRSEYYAGRPFALRTQVPWSEVVAMIEDGQWRDFDYLVLTMTEAPAEQRAYINGLLGCDPVVEYQNNRDGWAVVYETATCHERATDGSD